MIAELSIRFINLPAESIGPEIRSALQRIAEFCDVDADLPLELQAKLLRVRAGHRPSHVKRNPG